jgi:hypothetical protein
MPQVGDKVTKPRSVSVLEITHVVKMAMRLISNCRDQSRMVSCEGRHPHFCGPQASGSDFQSVHKSRAGVRRKKSDGGYGWASAAAAARITIEQPWLWVIDFSYPLVGNRKVQNFELNAGLGRLVVPISNACDQCKQPTQF